MEAHLKLPLMTVKVEGNSQKELFKALAGASEVFGERVCGLCKSQDIRPQWRIVTKGKKTFEYAEYACQKCYARLSLGMNQEGDTLFPKRRLTEEGKPAKSDEDGSYGSHQGWTKFKGNQED